LIVAPLASVAAAAAATAINPPGNDPVTDVT